MKIKNNLFKEIEKKNIMKKIKYFIINSISDLDFEEKLLIKIRKQLIEIGVVVINFQKQIKKGDFFKFSKFFGEPREMVYLRKDPKYSCINIVDKIGQKKSIFGDVWHSDHAYEQLPPKFTMIHCSIIPPYGGQTLFSFNYLSYQFYSKKYKLDLKDYEIINFAPKSAKKLLYKHSEDYLIKASSKKPLIEKCDGKIVFRCNEYHTVLEKQLDNNLKKDILPSIFSAQKNDKIIQKVNWKKNQIVIWNNDLILHKSINNFDEHHRQIWRILLDYKFYS